ncbi:hypothetical protein SDC9_182453 [bioreactor metagenome]|uniref:Uncharacterized protein n=1 Tax=bioreactor metagenome TaxID=1076179 RepID=A0A645HA12_9ZZZZ
MEFIATAAESTPPKQPTTVCLPCNTAGRRARASRFRGTGASTAARRWGWSAGCSATSFPASAAQTSPSGTCGIRRRGTACSSTRSRCCLTRPRGKSRWRTTETSSTRGNYVTNWSRTAFRFKRPSTPRSLPR